MASQSGNLRDLVSETDECRYIICALWNALETISVNTNWLGLLCSVSVLSFFSRNG